MVDCSGELACQTNASKAEKNPFGCGWYFPREQIEERSLSRKDGISLTKENQLRKSYCVFLRELGMRLELPQLTIATSIVFCHRYFLRQSHSKNDRFLIATACMFLAGKVEETPKLLKNVLKVSYEIRHKREKAAAAERIQQKGIYEHEKERVLLAEDVLLQTLGYDLNIIHPYKRLVTALQKLKISEKSLAQVAWNFLNDALRTSLCLQYEAHHIAAGAIFLAAKFLKIKLPTDGEKQWWQELMVAARQLEDVSNQMLELYDQHGDSSLSPSGAAGSVTLPEILPGTPQVVEKRKNSVKGWAGPEVEHLCTRGDNSKPPYISHNKESVEEAELGELVSVNVTMESKPIHPRCGMENCHEPEPKRPCSGL